MRANEHWGTGDRFFDVRWAHWLADTLPNVTSLVEVANARLFFPDERAQDLVPHLEAHWHSTAAAAALSGSRVRARRVGAVQTIPYGSGLTGR